MKEKILTAVSTLMIFVPWTILPLRTFDWALESPAAEIMIACYAGFMIFGGLFTILSYMKARVQNNHEGMPCDPWAVSGGRDCRDRYDVFFLNPAAPCDTL